MEKYKSIFPRFRSRLLFFIDYNRIIPKQQEQAKWGERLGYSKEITADKGNRKNREKSRIQRQTQSEKLIKSRRESRQKEKKMLSLLFTICMIWIFGKLFIFGVKAAWGISKLLLTVVFLPLILIGMVIGGLMSIAFPILIIVGIVALVAPGR